MSQYIDRYFVLVRKLLFDVFIFNNIEYSVDGDIVTANTSYFVSSVLRINCPDTNYVHMVQKMRIDSDAYIYQFQISCLDLLKDYLKDNEFDIINEVLQQGGILLEYKIGSSPEYIYRCSFLPDGSFNIICNSDISDNKLLQTINDIISYHDKILSFGFNLLEITDIPDEMTYVSTESMINSYTLIMIEYINNIINDLSSIFYRKSIQ